jgi:hypothetical protein
LETHLAAMHRDVKDFEPAGVVVDPMSSLMGAGLAGDVHSMILRLVDFLKDLGVTGLFTNLGLGSAETTTPQMQISSLMDTWLLLYNRESNGEHNRQLYVLKSRAWHTPTSFGNSFYPVTELNCARRTLDSEGVHRFSPARTRSQGKGGQAPSPARNRLTLS